MKNAILYVRVSTDEQAKLGYSLGHQEIVLTKFCQLKQLNIVAIYKEDFSAKNFARPEYKKMFQYCKANRKSIDYILISKWDRFARNATDALQEIKRSTEIGVEVNAVEQWIDFSIPHNKMLLSIYLTIPEIDNDIRGINTKMGLRRSRKLGRWTGKAPVGYKNQRDVQNKPILVKGEDAILVEEAFELFATGLYDKQELRKMMWKKGLKISKSQFPVMLANVIYCGKVFICEYKDEEASVVMGIHEPIVSEELFDKVQQVLTGRAKTKKQYETLNEATPLRGLITCSRCGGKLTSSASKGRKKYYTYYHCRNGCPERIPAESAHNALTNYLNELAVKPEIQLLFFKIREHVCKENSRKHQEHVNKVAAELRIADEKLTALENKHVTDKISKESYDFMLPKYQAEIKGLKNEAAKIADVETHYMKYVRSGIDVIQNAAKYYDRSPLELKQKIVGSIFLGNMTIENNECRTAQKNHVILALKGFEQDFKRNGRPKSHPFRLST